MNKDHITSFEERYLSELGLHFESPSSDKIISEKARLLGKEAFDLGIEASGLVRIHERALADITALIKPKTSLSQDKGVTPAGIFLIASLTEIESRNFQSQQDGRDAKRHFEEQLKEEIQRYNELSAESEHLHEQSRQFARKVLLAQEEERKEISRELHDKIAQILTAVNIQLATIREVGVINFESFEKSVDRIQKMIEDSVDSIHQYARKLRPAVLDDLGLIPALRSYIKELPQSNKLKIHFKTLAKVENMDSLRRTVFFRVAQESLLNAIRHSGAHCITVRLQEIPKGIRLEVHDDGKSFLADQAFYSKDYKRLGLLGMKERVEIVNGTFSIESTPSTGTTVRADVPFFENIEGIDK